MEQLRKIRRAKNITLKQLGEMTGINYSVIAKYEKGTVIPPSDKLQIIASALGVKIDELLDYEEFLKEVRDNPSKEISDRHIDIVIKHIENIIGELEEKTGKKMTGERCLLEQESRAYFSELKHMEYMNRIWELKDSADQYANKLVQRYDTYFAKYNKKDKRVSFDFENVLSCIEKHIPDYYTLNPVTVKYLSPFSRINFDPYKNHGNLLTEYFSYIDTATGAELNLVSKGEQYLPKTLYYINLYKDYSNIAPLFLLVFLNDYKTALLRSGTMDDYTHSYLLQRSKDYLIREDYSEIDYRWKRFIPKYYTDEETDEKLKQLEKVLYNEKITDTDKLAQLIITCINLSVTKWQMVYFRYSDAERERANILYKDTIESFQSYLMDIINPK